MIDVQDRMADRIQHARECLSRRIRLDNGEPLAPGLDLAVFERTLDNSFDEHYRYQNLQSQAFAMGKLSFPEAQRIYAALGEVPAADGWAEGTDLATKLIVTEVLGELVAARIRRS